MKAVTFYLIMFCYFKFILWINCEAELIREEKQKKRPGTRGFWFFCVFLRVGGGRRFRATKAR
ncbi:hypothetical protein, partial [Escherichia coli]|uniref:hypothetical protein n=1 Tax=Escherichia coli TaxID=562 RepID=UPI003896A838